MNRASGSKLVSLVLAVGIAACGAGDASQEEFATPTLDGKLDSFRTPTHHGFLSFGERVAAELTDEQFFHTWAFELDGPAEVLLYTEQFSYESPRELDTVLYLYRRQDDGRWGEYIERNDDAYEGYEWSELSVALDVGVYRVLVKGFRRSDLGYFALMAQCSGDGCGLPPPPPWSCDNLSEWVGDGGCPDYDDPAHWELCLANTPWGDVYEASQDCCGDPDYPYGWCR